METGSAAAKTLVLESEAAVVVGLDWVGIEPVPGAGEAITGDGAPL